MSKVSRSRRPANSDASSWDAWTDAHVWNPTGPAEPPAAFRAGSTSVELHHTAGLWWVDWRVAGQLEDARSFDTVEQARRYAASLFGEGGCAPGESSPFDVELHTTSALAHWLAESCPEPELSVSGRWVEPSYETATGGID